MLLNKDTTILELRKAKLISVRTYNCLYAANMETIGDILDKIEIPFDLMNIPKFGRKSLMEVEGILNKMQNHPVIMLASDGKEQAFEPEKSQLDKITKAYKAVVHGKSKVNAYLKARFPEQYSLHKLVIDSEDGLMAVAEGFSREENIEIRKAYLRFMNLVLKDVDDKTIAKDPLFAEYKLKADSLSYQIEYFSYEQIAKHFISPLARDYLEKVYHEKLKKNASIRARHLADAYLPHFYDLIKYAAQPFGKYQDICKGRTMLTTLEEIFNFNQDFKKDFDRIANLSDEEIKEIKIKEDYLFLFDFQQQFVIEFTRKFQHKPLFFILLIYLITSNDRSNKIYSLTNGICDTILMSSSNIAEMMGLTRERVRQILSEKIEVQKSPIVSDEDWKWYEELFQRPFICEKDKVYEKVRLDERLLVDFKGFAALVKLVADFYVEKVRQDRILINKKFDRQNTRMVLGELDEIINAKRWKETFVPIDNLVMKVPEDNRQDIKQLLLYILKYIYKEEVSEDGIIHLKQNYVDVAEELQHILEEKGKPTHVDELYKVFMTRYPNYKYTNSLQIKPYLQKNENIRPIGKSSCYALSSWEGIYFGSIRDLLMDLLRESDIPLHIDVLVEKVKKHYPKTTKSSVSATMNDEHFNRFVAFEGGFFGLTSKTYPKEFVEMTSKQRFSFDERLAMLKDFVNANHRLPNYKWHTRESTLARWLHNVKTGVIKTTDQQKMSLDQIIKKYK